MTDTAEERLWAALRHGQRDDAVAALLALPEERRQGLRPAVRRHHRVVDATAEGDPAPDGRWQGSLGDGHRSAAVAALLGCSTVAQALTVTGLGPPHSYDLPLALFPEHLEEFAAEWFSRFQRNPKAWDRLVGVDAAFDWAHDGLIAPPTHGGAVLLLATSGRGASSGRWLLDYLEARPVLIDVTMRRVFDVDGITGASLAQRDDGAAPGDRMDDFVVPELVRRGHWSVDFVEDGITRALDRGQTPYLRRWFLGLREQVEVLR